MNIIILISSLKIGGAEVLAINEANVLAEKGHKVLLAYFIDGPLTGKIKENVAHILITEKTYFTRIFALFKLVRKFKIDIIHANLFAPEIVSAVAGFLTGKPVIWHFHGHRYNTPNFHRYTLKLLSKLPNVKRILLVCEELRDYYLNSYFTADKLKVLYNGMIYSNNNHHPVPKNSDKKPFTIGFVGRLIPLKRVGYLLEFAFQAIKSDLDLKVLIIGDGPEYPGLLKYVQDNNLKDVVEFIGQVSRPEKYYQMINLIVLPSMEEAMSMVLIEAHQYGIPCIAFDVGGNKEVIQDGKTGYIVETKEQLFENIFELMKDGDKLDALSIGARKNFYDNFTIDKHIKGLEKIYSEAFSGRTQ